MHLNQAIAKETAVKPGLQPVEASVASFTRHYQARTQGLTVGEVSRTLGLILEELAAVIRQSGGFIGHIKAFASFTPGGAVGLSVVRDMVERKEAGLQPLEPALEFKFAITAIVYGCPKEELTRLLNLGLAIGLPPHLCAPVSAKKETLTPIAFKMIISTSRLERFAV